MQNFTELGIKALPPAEGRAAYYWDETTKGLGLAVSPKGVKTFVVLVGSGRREKLGRWPNLKLADARIEAKKTLGAIALGRHRPETKRFDDAKDEFLKACGSRNRARTVADTRGFSNTSPSVACALGISRNATSLRSLIIYVRHPPRLLTP